MKKWRWPVLAAIAAISIGSSVQANILTVSVSGVFNGTGDLTSSHESNTLAPLIDQPYSMSISSGTGNSLLIRTEVGLGVLPDVGYFYSTNSSLTTPYGGYSKSYGGVVAGVREFYYDGSNDVAPAGYYDEFDLTGWLRGSGPVVDPIACGTPTGGSLLSSPTPGPCSLKGVNYAIDISLDGYLGLVSNFTTDGLASLDLSKVIYGSTEIREYNDGYLVGDITQDPALHYNDGVLSGTDMTVTSAITPVPEPASWAILVLGIGAIGAAMRHRERKVLNAA